MGDTLSCNSICCPSDKLFVASECSSPKNSTLRPEFSSPKNAILRPELTPITIVKDLGEERAEGSEYASPSESPGIKGRNSLRKNSVTFSPSKKSFLAMARIKHRNSSQISFVSNECEDYALTRIRSLTYAECEAESIQTYQTRISIDSPGQHAGDYEIIDF